MVTPQRLPLGADFPAATREAWLAEVAKVLDGASFDRKLVGRTYDGLTIQPLYDATNAPAAARGIPGSPPFTRASTAAAARATETGAWDIRQHHFGADPVAVNEAVLADLERGVTSISLGPVGDGTAGALGRALHGVLLDLAPICLDWGAASEAGADALIALWAEHSVDGQSVRGELGFDPLGLAAATGGAPEYGPAVRAALAGASRRPGVRALRADGTVYANAGASDSQELAYTLATAVAHLRALVDGGLALGDAFAQIAFRLSAGVDQFSTIAKLRALRTCWARVAEASGSPEYGGQTFVHAVTSLAQYSRLDRFVNPLRATLACFAAAVGGADAITVLPMGAAAGQWDEAGRRLARNTQLMLAEESNLARVIDPGGGSYYVEALTDDLAADAWRRFQAVEAAGGMAAVLADGSAAADVRATWEARLANLSTRRDPLTGVSEFPFLDEEPLAGALTTLGAPGASGTGAPDAAFPLRRWSAPFEALRDAAQRAPEPPQVFSANLGPIATHTARATFARNLFEAGGIRTTGGDTGYDSAEAVAAAFSASGCSVAVICSSDSLYAERAEATAAALKAAGATRVYLAGNPGERRGAYEAAGVDEFVYIGTDVLAALHGAQRALGLQA